MLPQMHRPFELSAPLIPSVGSCPAKKSNLQVGQHQQMMVAADTMVKSVGSKRSFLDNISLFWIILYLTEKIGGNSYLCICLSKSAGPHQKRRKRPKKAKDTIQNKRFQEHKEKIYQHNKITA